MTYSNTDSLREHCTRILEEMQKNPNIHCDIVSPAMFMSTDVLVQHTDAYIDYLRRVQNEVA